jgi:hypothetical protein
MANPNSAHRTYEIHKDLLAAIAEWSKNLDMSQSQYLRRALRNQIAKDQAAAKPARSRRS